MIVYFLHFQPLIVIENGATSLCRMNIVGIKIILK